MIVWMLMACGSSEPVPRPPPELPKEARVERVDTIAGFTGTVGFDEKRLPGDIFLQSVQSKGCCAVVLEDRGDAALLYVLDMRLDMDHRIVDSVGIWSTQQLPDRERERRLVVLWVEQQALLLVDGEPKAVVDFPDKRAYGHEPRPPAVGQWADKGRRTWSADALAPFQATP